MDWNNIDTNDNYEMSQAMLDSYTFETLMLEVNCNVRDITRDTVKAQALESLKSKYECAIEVLEANLDALTAKAIADRNQ